MSAVILFSCAEVSAAAPASWRARLRPASGSRVLRAWAQPVPSKPAIDSISSVADSELSLHTLCIFDSVVSFQSFSLCDGETHGYSQRFTLVFLLGQMLD